MQRVFAAAMFCIGAMALAGPADAQSSTVTRSDPTLPGRITIQERPGPGEGAIVQPRVGRPGVERTMQPSVGPGRNCRSEARQQGAVSKVVRVCD